jgi:hypothetical protein
MKTRHGSLKPLLFSLLLLAGAPALASSALVTCESLLRANAARDTTVERAILDEVNTATIDYDNARALGAGVLRFPLRDGNQVVLRLADDTAHPAFESFASRVIQNAPGSASPSVKVLSAPEVTVLLQGSKSFGGLKVRSAGGTLAVYFPQPMEVGHHYLEEHVGLEIRERLAEYAKIKNFGYSRLLLPQYEARLHARWRIATDAARATVGADLRALIAELKDVPDGKLLDAFVDHADKFTPIRIEMLHEAAWSHLPAALQTQLADAWAILTVLGIPDFHFGNWLILDGKVLVIDAALRSPEFVAGRATLELDGQNSPIAGGRLSPMMRKRLARAVSATLAEHLGQLSNAQLAELAAHAGYPLTVMELMGIKGRVRLLLELR